MTNSPASSATIDCHAHVFTQDVALKATAWIKPEGNASVEDYRATLDAFGLRRAVLAASSLHADNTYALAATDADRRLRTTVIVPPETSAEELVQFAAAGACGIRLQLRNKELPDLRSPAYRAMLKNVAELGWHVQLHDDAHRLPPLINAIEESGAALVIDHFGRPGEAGAADPGFRAVIDAVSRGRTWVKISGAFRLPDPLQDRALAEELLAAGGPDRLMWGSDWPFVGFENTMTYAHAIADFERAVPSEALRSAIERTAINFYFGADCVGA